MTRHKYLVIVLAACAIAGCVSKETVNLRRTREARQLPRGRKIRYEGGTGESREQAVVIIGAEDLKEGVAAEYDFISELHGKKGKKWRVKGQSQVREAGRIYDMIEIRLIDSQRTHYYYFDITNCSWKSPAD